MTIYIIIFNINISNVISCYEKINVMIRKIG